MSTDIGKLEQIDISFEARRAYLDYAMSVIVARALPDVRDGLKPVHRRVLYAMHHDLGLTHEHKYSKCAGVVGEVLKKYHPHGDMAVYDSLVRLAQWWNLRYTLVDGQGNFGSIDGDSPAAYRYTEARLTKIAGEMLNGIDKETVDFIPNFDGETQEPLVLPSSLPNLLLMGSEGIAVGMATKIPPHNITEVIDAVTFTIDRTVAAKKMPDEVVVQSEERTTHANVKTGLVSDVTIDELMDYIKGPDFPTGGSIYDITEIRNVYATGRGKIVMRGKAEIEEIGQGKSAIIITEIPYQVNKSALVAKIAELAKLKKIEGISDLRDESDRHGLRVVVELKRDSTPKKILNNLYKQTQLQTTFPANVVALVDGVPRTLNLKTIVDEYIKHRYVVVTRRSEFELREAQARLHILDGLKIAVNNIDEVVAIIRKSKNVDEARTSLIDRFKLSEIQANAILDMQLRRLTALEIDKLEEEWKKTKEIIDRLEDLLAHPEKILKVVKDELLEIRENYGDVRKTKVYKSKVDEFSDEDLIANEPTVITITKTGYIKRQSLLSFKTQARGGKGVKGMTTKDEDIIDTILFAQTHDNILFFTSLGKVFQTRVFEMGEASRVAKGQAIVNLIDIQQGEKICSILAYNPKEQTNFKNIFMATKRGVVKKQVFQNLQISERQGSLQLNWINQTLFPGSNSQLVKMILFLLLRKQKLSPSQKNKSAQLEDRLWEYGVSNFSQTTELFQQMSQHLMHR